MKKIIFALVLLFSITANAQNEKPIIFELGTEFPLNYSLGFGADIYENVQFTLRAGILTKPYDAIILNTLKLFGVEESYTNTIGDSFTHGFVLKGGLNYKFEGFYIGAYYSFFRLNAADVPTDLLNNFYGINLPTSSTLDFIEYHLRSNLHNLGVSVGKSFPINEQFSIGGEFSMAKTIGSKSGVSSNFDPDMVMATGIIHKELDPLYKKYGFLPSVNIFIRFKLLKAKT